MKGIVRQAVEWGVLILAAWLISLVIRTYVIDTRVVPTGSMLPTIQLDDRLIVDKLFFRFSQIRRGDIVVFRAPPEAGEKEELVKRVIGLPGEKFEVRNGKVWINDRVLTEDYVLQPPDYRYGPVVIPANAYFVMGDNRRNSKDSHIWGFLPKNDITGRVLLRYWPLSSFGHLAGPPARGYPAQTTSTSPVAGGTKWFLWGTVG